MLFSILSPYRSYSVFIEIKIMLDIQERCFLYFFFYIMKAKLREKYNRNFTAHILQEGQENEPVIR